MATYARKHTTLLVPSSAHMSVATNRINQHRTTTPCSPLAALPHRSPSHRAVNIILRINQHRTTPCSSLASATLIAHPLIVLSISFSVSISDATHHSMLTFSRSNPHRSPSRHQSCCQYSPYQSASHHHSMLIVSRSNPHRSPSRHQSCCQYHSPYQSASQCSPLAAATLIAHPLIVLSSPCQISVLSCSFPLYQRPIICLHCLACP
jgi:hypothetical protein